MSHPVIIAAGCRIDGHGTLAGVNATAGAIVGRGYRLSRLHIAPLSHPWTAPLPPGHFRSGCAPLEALDTARQLLATGEADAVVLQGRDLLHSEYAGDRELRTRRMAVFGEEQPLTEAYTILAKAFCRRVGLDDAGFRDLAERLFENHLRVWADVGHPVRPGPEWFEPVTELFRRVDCANPVVDFEAAVVVTTAAVAEACGVPAHQRIPGAAQGLRPS